MRKTLCFILLLTISIVCNATTPAYIDSVKQVLKNTQNKSEQLLALYTLSFEYGKIEPQKGLEYGRKCLSLAESEKNLNFQLNAYNGIANAYETLGKYDSAKYFHLKSYQVAKKMQLAPKIALTLVNVALCLKQLGHYREALQMYLEAYKILEKQDAYNPRIHFYLGEMYIKTGDLKNAEIQSKLGIKKCKEFHHDYVIYDLYVNLAQCHLQNNKSDSALLLLTETTKALRRHTDKISLGKSLSVLAETYMQKKLFERAYVAYEEELRLQRELKNNNGIIMALLNTANANVRMKNKNTILIKNNLNEAQELLIKAYNNKDLLSSAYLKAAETYELLGDIAISLNYYKSYYQLKDSLFNKEQLEKINELQAKYESEKKENQIVILKNTNTIKSLEIINKNNSIKKRNLIIYLGLFSFILFLIALYFFIQRQKFKNKLEKEKAIKLTEENERLRIAKDIHDDLGSGLSKIHFLSELIIRDKEVKNETTENAHSILETAKKLVINMKDLIWALNPENTTLQGLLSRIREHTSDYLEDFPAEVSIDLPTIAFDAKISKEAHRQILMAIKESLNNVVKHSGAAMIELNAKLDDSQIYFCVRDNGIGIREFDKKGNGMNNMRSRIESIGGNLKIDSESSKGTSITIAIPLKKIYGT